MATIDNNTPSLFSSNTTLSGVSYSSSSKTEDKSAISKDAFLQIMIAKLSNQDPLNPTDDTEFLSQLAQFTTLEQMINMTDTLTLDQSFDMVGKYVVAEYNGTYITGRVDSVIYDSGEITLDVGGALVGMDKVKEVLAEKYMPEAGAGDTVTEPDSSTEAGDAVTDTEASAETDTDSE